MNPFKDAYDCYREVLAAERRRLSPPDYPSGASCHGCQAVGDARTFKRCAGCKTVLYCSKECQTADWQGRMVRESRPHKEWCAVFKRHVLRLPTVQAVITSFPWGRLESDGTFFDELLAAKLKILGGAGFGFWSQTGLGLYEDEEDDIFLEDQRGRFPDSDWVKDHEELREKQKRIQFINGQDLLKKAHLTDDLGWKLPAHLVLRRDFSVTKSPGRLSSVIQSWDEWYAWRGLSKASPVALLMHYPLSIYRILTHTLGVTTVRASKSQKRVPLTVHYIGAEIELNFIPIFSELALLLPNHDIDIVFFGPCVFNIGQEGRKSKHRSSLVSLTAQESGLPIFSYDAPKDSGAGRLRVFLHTATKHWTIGDISTYGFKPDAIIACNAGLFLYEGSEGLVKAAMRHAIPFAVTDYQEFMLESNSAVVSHMTGHHEPQKPVELNPFHRPGQRHYPRDNLAPSLDNGFILVVSESEPKDESERTTATSKPGAGAGARGLWLGRRTYTLAFLLAVGLIFFNYVLPP